jgi:hypothetical protein
MSESMIPSLHLNTGLLFNKSDILTYIVRHYLYAPSGIYENYVEEEISFAKSYAKNNGSIERLSNTMIQDLTDVLQRYFENYPLTIDVVSSFEDEKATSLTIDIKVSDKDKIYSISPNIEIDNQTHKFKINFSDI